MDICIYHVRVYFFTFSERDVLLQMLKVAHDDSEETRLQKVHEIKDNLQWRDTKISAQFYKSIYSFLTQVINDVLQPDSAERVQQWLTAADGSG